MLTFNFSPFPDLQTKRLKLRAISLADAEALFELRSDPEIMKHLDKPVANNVGEVRELIGKMVVGVEKNENITWAVTLLNNPRLVGFVGFWRIEPENHRAEIGYMLHKNLHRQGLMDEAIKKTLEFGFGTMRLHAVEGHVNPNNEGSVKLLERNNFKREAFFKENHYYNGKFLDTAIYTLFWRDLKKSE